MGSKDKGSKLQSRVGYDPNVLSEVNGCNKYCKLPEFLSYSRISRTNADARGETYM